LCLWLGPAAVASLLLARVSVVVGEAEGKPVLRMLSPADRCVLESGKVELLCVAPDTQVAAGAQAIPGAQPAGVPLRVDGKPGKWEPYARPVLFAKLELTPGRHELRIGDRQLRLFVADAEGEHKPPDGWPVHRSHSTGTGKWKDCTLCHELEKREGRASIKDLKDPLPCLGCHSADEFASTHFHVLKPIENCQLCHALHGSTRKALLKAPAKELCADCHD